MPTPSLRIANRAALGLLLLLLTAPAPMTRAEELDTIPETSTPWNVDVYAWLWLMGVSGDVGIGAVNVSGINASFADVVDESDSLFALSGRVEVGKEKVRLFVDGTYADIGIDDQSGAGALADVDVTMEIGVIDFGLLYQLTSWGQTETRGPGTLDVYVAGRYFGIDMELDPALAPTQSGREEWVDPIVGLKLRQPVADRLHLDLWGDVGGFGVESDLTWSATALLGYDFELFSLPATVYGGYRAIGWDYEEGSGADRFEWDAVLHGPAFGLQLSF